MISKNKVNRNSNKKNNNSINKDKSLTKSKVLKQKPIKGTIKGIPEVFILVLDEACKEMNLTYPIPEIVEQVKDYHNKMIINHGVIDGTKRFNANRLLIIRMIEGEDVKSLSFHAVSKKHKFPSALYKLLDLYLISTDLSNPLRSEADRVMRSLFYVNKLVKDNSEIDIGKITDKFDIDNKTKQEFRSFIREWVSEVNFNRSHDLITEPTERFIKNGPNGDQKWKTADIEAYALYHSPLWKPFKEINDLTGNQNLTDFVYKLSQSEATIKAVKAYEKKYERKVRLRWITSIKDKGNKSRLVAMSDYFTQVQLFPVMEEVKSITSEHFHLFSDSLSHAFGFKQLLKHAREGICSYDISSWTDAFPADLQKIVLEELFSPELADNWYKLVVKCDWNVAGMNNTIQYGRGQGMGTAGSFDIAMLTDILLLMYLYKTKYNMTPKDGTFRKVGDDLWCYDPQKHIYNFYVNVIGLEINIQKTKVCTAANICAEYVSRNINFGVDVSRISPNICKAVEANIFDIPQLVAHLAERNVSVDAFPLNKILSHCIKDHSKINLFVRSFWVLCLLNPDRDGIEMLKKSLIRDYGNFIASDAIISALKNEREFKSLQYTYYTTQIKDVLCKIEQKIKTIFQSHIPIYECSLDLIEDNVKANSFKYRTIKESSDIIKLSLPGITSQYILAKCYRLINELSVVTTTSDPNYKKPKENQVNQPVIMVVSHKSDRMPSRKCLTIKQSQVFLGRLNTIYENLTFKEHNIIAKRDKRLFRQTVTSVHNMTSNLYYLPDTIEVSDLYTDEKHSPRMLALVKQKRDMKNETSSFLISYLPFDSSIEALPEGNTSESLNHTK